MKNLRTNLLTLTIIASIAGVVASNYAQERAIDKSKIPQDVELSKEFQRWITNQKKRIDVSADEFRLKEKNEIFNSANLSIQSADDEKANNDHLARIEQYLTYDNVNFSPNDFEYLDYRNPHEVYYHALREDKIIDSKILTCSVEANCYFDRAFFVDNHTFVISEFSRNIDKKDLATAPECGTNELCSYTIKLHLYDFINNARFVYESEVYEFVLDDMSQYF